MRVYVAVSVSIIPPIVEVFAAEKDANVYAFRFKERTGHTLNVKPCEVHE